MNYPKLPKRFKAKWIAALRSGEFRQGTVLLYDPTDETYCCMGVAGKVCGLSSKAMTGFGFFREQHVKHGAPRLLLGDGSNELPDILSGFNDSRGWSFNRIANWIEKYL